MPKGFTSGFSQLWLSINVTGMAMDGTRRRSLPSWFLSLLLALAPGMISLPGVWGSGLSWINHSAEAQRSGVTLRVLPTDLGLDGSVRYGSWVPVRLKLLNESAEAREVICRWVYPDADGDQVSAERRLVLDAIEDEQAVWLYGMPQEESDPVWRFEVRDAEDRSLLFTLDQSPQSVVERTTSLLGVCGTTVMGLEAHSHHITQHEPMQIRSGLSLANLPDRWYGLDMLDTLIWTPTDIGPEFAPSIVLDALGQWVRRGGRLIIVLPGRNQTWSESALGSFMPVPSEAILATESDLRDLGFLGSGPAEPSPIPTHHFVKDPTAAPPGVPPGAMMRGADGRAYVVTKRRGLGAVTLIGIDLTLTPVRRAGLPTTQGNRNFWNRVMGWRYPVMTQAQADRNYRDQLQRRPQTLPAFGLGAHVAGKITMRGQVTVGIFGATGLFLLYFLIAGLLLYRSLSGRGLVQYTWVAFLVAVGVFTAISWTGAWLLQAKTQRLTHVTVLDVIHASNEDSGLAHVRSDFSLYLPKFGRIDVELAPEQSEIANTLSSPTLPLTQRGAGFLDPQVYVLDSDLPIAADAPMRSTDKRWSIDYLGAVDERQDGLDLPYGLFSGRAFYEESNGVRLPVGKISHALPGDLEQVLIVFCPGTPADATSGNPDARMPIVWRPDVATWPAGQALDVSRPANNFEPLVAEPRWPSGDRPGPRAADGSETTIRKDLWDDRDSDNEGFLGRLAAKQVGVPLSTGVALPVDRGLADQIERLSFFSRLPPPAFRMNPGGLDRDAFSFRRLDGHDLDLSHLLDEPRLIIIGHLSNAPLPAPLTVNGRAVESNGHTVVRFIQDLEPKP